MNCNWKEFRLGDLTTWASGSTPSKQNPSFWGGEIPWISGTVMRSKNLSDSDLYLTQEGLENKGKLCKKDSILLLVRGDLFKRIPIGIATKSLCFNQDIKAINSVSNNLLQHYIYYLLEGNKKRLSNIVEFTGLGAGKLDTKLLQNLTFKIPPIHYQKNVIKLIDSIDCKIELNRENNKNLEEIAKALFKSWFIDFDPVKAKAEGLSTGLPHGISDLFPDSFEESELGNIPENWAYKNIGDVFETILGGTPSRKNSEYWEGNIPWIGSGMVNEFRVIKETEFITELGLVKSSTKLLPKRSTLIAITGATLGQISINEIEVCTNQSVVAIKPCKKTSPEFVFLWVQKNVNYLINSQTGGAQQHINKNNVNEMKILLPNRKIMEIFGNIVKPIFDKISINLFESETLSNLRDQMLPKLISGEIRISDAEKMIDEVGI